MANHFNFRSNEALVVTVVDPGFPPFWTRVPGWGKSEVEGQDLLLNSRDLRNIKALQQQRLLDRWASNMGFSMAGVNRGAALGKLLRSAAIEACFAAAGDPAPHEMSGLLFDQLRDIVKHRRAPRMLPDLRLRMEGGCVASVILDMTDGPFKGTDPRAAIDRRLGHRGEEIMKWWPGWR